MSGQAGVFAGQDPALIGHELAKEVGVLEIERVGGKINFRFGARGPHFSIRGAAGRAAFFFLVRSSFAWHGLLGDYLISRWRVWRRNAGLYFLSSSFSVLSFLLRVVV